MAEHRSWLHLRDNRQPERSGVSSSRRVFNGSEQPAHLENARRLCLLMDSPDVPLQQLGFPMVPCCTLWYKHLSPSVSAKEVYSSIAKYKVSHLCAAHVVLNTIVNAPQEDIILPLPHTVHVVTAEAAPPPSVLFSMNQKGFRVTHNYGLSESYGPSTVCAWKPEWDSLPPETQAKLNSRQGVDYTDMEQLDVIDSQTGKLVPAYGKTAGEIFFRGNMVMKGYLKNPEANKETFAGGWFHSGDITVKHPDNYIKIKDRLKDIIISGGENISSVEVENVVYNHPVVLEASVVARPDERWQESPCAFVMLKSGYEEQDQNKLAQDIMRFCREKLPAYWVQSRWCLGLYQRQLPVKFKSIF